MSGALRIRDLSFESILLAEDFLLAYSYFRSRERQSNLSSSINTIWAKAGDVRVTPLNGTNGL